MTDKRIAEDLGMLSTFCHFYVVELESRLTRFSAETGAD